MIIQIKHFYDNLNIAVILTAGHEFFSAKYDQFSSTFTEWN